MDTQKATDTLAGRQTTKVNMDSGTTTVSASIYDAKNEISKHTQRAIAHIEQRLLDSLKTSFLAYGGALALTGVIIPIVASLTMAGIRLTHSDIPLFTLDPTSKWFPLLSSAIITAAIWLLAALFTSFFTTAKTANPHSYGLLISRLYQLKANLAIEDADTEFTGLGQRFGEINATLDKIKALKYSDTESTYTPRNPTALNDAYTCYIDICQMLQQSPAGLLWALGMGYINAWRLLHHAEEALIESQCTEEIIRGALHDKLAIQGSTISRKDELLDKLLQAAVTLQPVAAMYFKEHQPDKGDTELNQLMEALKRKIFRELMNENGLNDAQSLADPNEARALARVALREVRSTLNDFRDKSWEGIVRARNRLLGSIAVTGVVTHVLLAIAILTSNTIDAITAAVAFYLIGAVTGLFGRFYRESVAGTAVDDFGFSTARLVATPLLSGLAGVGGVMVTVMLASLGNTLGRTVDLTMNDIFHMDPRLFFVAAIFGLAPNLLIKGLQEKACKYEIDIQSSKAAEGDLTGCRD